MHPEALRDAESSLKLKENIKIFGVVITAKAQCVLDK